MAIRKIGLPANPHWVVHYRDPIFLGHSKRAYVREVNSLLTWTTHHRELAQFGHTRHIFPILKVHCPQHAHFLNSVISFLKTGNQSTLRNALDFDRTGFDSQLLDMVQWQVVGQNRSRQRRFKRLLNSLS